jgi:hypothetical protein
MSFCEPSASPKDSLRTPRTRPGVPQTGTMNIPSLTTRRARTAVLGGILAVSSVFLAGCGAAPFADSQSSTPTPTAPAEIVSITNDLATGSAQRQLTAGDIALTVNYWSDLSMDRWNPGASKPLSLSLTAALGTDQGQSVYLSKVTVVASVTGPTGTLAAPAPIEDASTIPLGYLVKAPYSYSQSYVLPAVDEAATEIVLNIKYELLLQTTPTSAEYAKQTASDTLTIALTPAS